jgi:hypothetical protein
MKLSKQALKHLIKEELEEMADSPVQAMAGGSNEADYILSFLEKLSAVGVGRNMDIKSEAKMAFEMMAKLFPEEAARYMGK